MVREAPRERQHENIDRAQTRLLYSNPLAEFPRCGQRSSTFRSGKPHHVLEQIWRQNQAVLRSIIRNVLQDSSCIDDVLQDSFAKLIRSKKEFSTPEETYQYIRKTVLNTSIDYYRDLKRRGFHLTVSAESEPYLLTSDHPNPLAKLMEGEKAGVERTVLRELEKAMKELTREQREAIDILFNRNHKKIKDICRERGIPYSTVRSRVTAGIDRLRRVLRAKGVYQRYEETK